MEFAKRKPAMMKLLQEMVEVGSPTYDRDAVNRMGAIASREVLRLGAKLETVPMQEVGDNLIARWGEGDGGILLMGHLDTVFPLGILHTMPFYEKYGKVFGPGTLDMKSGIVIMLHAIEALQEQGRMPKRPITMLLNSDEEMGSYHSRDLIEKVAKGHALTLVFEPCEYLEGTLHTWRKGTGKFSIKAEGKAAHSGGAHEKGLNAIEELSHQVVKVQQLTEYEKGTTINIGSMRGGRAINIVPAFAEADGDIRFMSMEEYKRVEDAINNLSPVLPHAALKTKCNLNRPPMPFDATMEATFDKAYNITKAEGLKIKAGGSGSASDANFVAHLGLPVLDGLGTVGEGFHTEDEYFLLDSFIERTHLAFTLLRDW